MHLKAGIKTIFVMLGLGYHHIKIIGLEFLERCGYQIRVNTLTVSYTCKSKTIAVSMNLCLEPLQCLKIRISNNGFFLVDHFFILSIHGYLVPYCTHVQN